MVNDTENRQNKKKPAKTSEDRDIMADPPANGDDRSTNFTNRSSRTTKRTDHGPTKIQSGSDRSKSGSSCTSVSGHSINEEDQMEMSKKVLQLVTDSRFTMTQINGQRKLGGPPPGWKGPAPGPGCEVFVGKIPRTLYEHEIYPVFRAMGEVYEIRLMMDFSGTNRGYCFVMFSKPEYAQRAIQELDNYEIRPGRRIGVVASINNCRLCVGQLPPDISSETVIKKICTITDDVGKVAVYRNINDQARYALISYKTHRGAAMARRRLVPDRSSLFEGAEVNVDWAHPNMLPSNVVEDSGTCDENGNVQMTTTVIGNGSKRSTSRRRVRDEFLDRSIRTYLQEERSSSRSGDPCGGKIEENDHIRSSRSPSRGTRFLSNVDDRGLAHELEHFGKGQGRNFGGTTRKVVNDEDDRFETRDPWNEVEGNSSGGVVKPFLENFDHLGRSLIQTSKGFPNGQHEKASIGWPYAREDGKKVDERPGVNDRQEDGMLRTQELDLKSHEIVGPECGRSVNGESMNLFDEYTFARFAAGRADRQTNELGSVCSVEGPRPGFCRTLESRSDGDIRKPRGIEIETSKCANFAEFGKWNSTESFVPRFTMAPQPEPRITTSEESERHRRSGDNSTMIDTVYPGHRRTERNASCQQTLLQVLLRDAKDHSTGCCSPNEDSRNGVRSSGSHEPDRSDRHFVHSSAFMDPWMISNVNVSNISGTAIGLSNRPLPRELATVNYAQNPVDYSNLQAVESKSKLNENDEFYYQSDPCSPRSHADSNAYDLESSNSRRSLNLPRGASPLVWWNRNVSNYLELANCSYRYRNNCEQNIEGRKRSDLSYLPKNFNAYQGAWSPVGNVLSGTVPGQVSNFSGQVIRRTGCQIHPGFVQGISGCISNGSSVIVSGGAGIINCEQNDLPRIFSNDRIEARLSSEQIPKGARPILNRSHASICNEN